MEVFFCFCGKVLQSNIPVISPQCTCQKKRVGLTLPSSVYLQCISYEERDNAALNCNVGVLGHTVCFVCACVYLYVRLRASTCP